MREACSRSGSNVVKMAAGSACCTMTVGNRCFRSSDHGAGVYSCVKACLWWTSAHRWNAKNPADTQTMMSGSSASASAGGAATLSQAVRPCSSQVAEMAAE